DATRAILYRNGNHLDLRRSNIVVALSTVYNAKRPGGTIARCADTPWCCKRPGGVVLGSERLRDLLDG
ncbi:MAG TPA: hypothetical protein VI251_11340, partial [Pseudolabrys sp.]